MQTERMMGRNAIRYGGGIAGMLFAGHLAAAPMLEVQVLGDIQHPGCTVMAPNGGTYDFGTVARTTTTRGGVVALPVITQTWRVRCEGDAYLSVTPVDNRQATRNVSDSIHFGLGHTADGHALGYFRMGVSNARQGTASAVLLTLGEGRAPYAQAFLTTGKRTEWGGENGLRRSAHEYAVDITVMPYVSVGEEAMPSTVALDGSVTLNFTFGI
ncbi:DUF1120 domain-containing protein [Serratia marcescens]